MGKLIVIEGACDGIGKTTQYNLLKDKIIENGMEVVTHHFPSYNTYQGAPVEHYLKGEFGNPSTLSPYFVNTLYAVDRAITWKSILEKEMKNDKVILLDRYTTSSLIYQSALIDDIEENKKFIDYVSDFEYNKLGIQKPTDVIFLSAPFDLVTKIRNERQSNEGIKQDIHESNIEFMKKVYDNSLFISKYLGWTNIQCNEGDKMRSIEDINNEIVAKLGFIKNIPKEDIMER